MTRSKKAAPDAAALEQLAAENDHLKVQVAVLRAMEQRFRATLYGIGDAVIVTDVHGSIKQVNRVAESLTGWPEADALGRPVGEVFRIVNEETRATPADPVARVIREGTVTGLANHTLLIARNGSEQAIADSAAPVFDESGKVAGVVLVFRDVSAERRHELEREQLTHALQDRVKELNCLHQLGRIVEEEPGDIEAILTNAVQLLPLAVQHPEDAVARVLWDGRAFASGDWADAPCRLSAGLRVGDRTAGAVEIAYRHGHAPASEGSFLPEERALLGTFAERLGRIVERVEATEALRRLNRALAQSNQDLEQFAYAASHDLQEPLRKVVAFGSLLEEEYGARLGDEGGQYVRHMREATRRMQALISDLLTYSRVATRGQRFTAVDMNETVRGVLSDLEVRIRETQAVVEVTELPTVVADPTQMRQLLQNLIGNALKFHKEGEPPRVRVSAEPDQPDEGTPGGSSVRIVVQDSGIGFDEKYAERIFGLFQRLNPRHAYDGSGIGLAVCRRIAERHGGTVTAHSNPGEGTRFIVCLPLKHETREQEV